MRARPARRPVAGAGQPTVAVTAAGVRGLYAARRSRWASARRSRFTTAPASARLAVAEAITNIAAADVVALRDIRLSANWMAAAGHADDDCALYAMVRAVGEELCPALGIAIPVGKDSLSMRTVWQDARRQAQAVTAPVSLIVSAFAPVARHPAHADARARSPSPARRSC